MSSDRSDNMAADLKTLQTLVGKWDGSADTFTTWRTNAEYGLRTVCTWPVSQQVEWLSRSAISDKADGIYRQLPVDQKTVAQFFDDIAAILNLTSDVEMQWHMLARNGEPFNVFAAKASSLYCRRKSKHRCDDEALLERLRSVLSPEVANQVIQHFRPAYAEPYNFVNLVSIVTSFEMGKVQPRRNPGIGFVTAVNEPVADENAMLLSKVLRDISSITTQAVQATSFMVGAGRR
jgi:hypothetical protein